MYHAGIISCYRSQTKFAKVVFSQASVILSTEGICIQGGGLPPGGWADPPHGILRDTVPEWTVHILLECILVFYKVGRISVRRTL